MPGGNNWDMTYEKIYKSELSRLINQGRLVRRLSKQELARKTGINENSVNSACLYYNNNAYTVGIARMLAMASFLKVSIPKYDPKRLRPSVANALINYSPKKSIGKPKVTFRRKKKSSFRVKFYTSIANRL